MFGRFSFYQFSQIYFIDKSLNRRSFLSFCMFKIAQSSKHQEFPHQSKILSSFVNFCPLNFNGWLKSIVFQSSVFILQPITLNDLHKAKLKLNNVQCRSIRSFKSVIIKLKLFDSISSKFYARGIYSSTILRKFDSNSIKIYPCQIDRCCATKAKWS